MTREVRRKGECGREGKGEVVGNSALVVGGIDAPVSASIYHSLFIHLINYDSVI